MQTNEDVSYEIIVSGGPGQKSIPTENEISAESTVYYPWGEVETVEDLESLWGWRGKINYKSL